MPTTLPAPLTAPCPVCGTQASVTAEMRRLPCGHVAFRTATGVVVGWADTGAMTVNLDRMVEWPVPVTERMAERMEQHAAGVLALRAATPQLGSVTDG